MRQRKIKELDFAELQEILMEAYGRLGIDLTPEDEKLKRTCTQLFEYQQHIFADSIIGMFEMYANGALKCPGLKTDVSGWFFKQLKDAFFENAEEKKKKASREAEKAFHRDRGKVAYTRFMLYCDRYRKFPLEEEWVLILKFLVREKGWKLYEGFDKEPEEIQIKTARVHIKSFAKEFFTLRSQGKLVKKQLQAA